MAILPEADDQFISLKHNNLNLRNLSRRSPVSRARTAFQMPAKKKASIQFLDEPFASNRDGDSR